MGKQEEAWESLHTPSDHLCTRLGRAARIHDALSVKLFHGSLEYRSSHFQAWSIEITCILISSTHQPTTCVQMRWNDSGFVAGICCPLNILLQRS